MNDIIKAMKERRSIRKFKLDMPEKDDIEQIIEPDFMLQTEWVNKQQ